MTSQDSPLDRIICNLEECRKTMNAKEGLSFLENLSGEIGAKVDCNPEGGIIIRLDEHTIHVWQPYPDIDRIYYEY